MTKLNINEKGQALLFVVVALTIAMAVGVGVSVRTLSAVSRTSRTDTASRVLAAAEGGGERFLALTRNQLDSVKDYTASGGTSGECPAVANISAGSGYCVVNFSATGTDLISAEAHVQVFDYSTNIDTNIGPGLYFRLMRGGVKEVVLDGLSNNTEVTVCWKPVNNPTGRSDLYYFTYNNSGILEKNGFYTNAAAPAGYSISPDGFDPSIGGGCPTGYNYRRLISLRTSDDPYGLRFKTLADDSDVILFPNHALPSQGYKVISTGILSNQNDVNATVAKKVVTVYKSLPYLSPVLDFGVVSGSGINFIN